MHKAAEMEKDRLKVEIKLAENKLKMKDETISKFENSIASVQQNVSFQFKIILLVREVETGAPEQGQRLRGSLREGLESTVH